MIYALFWLLITISAVVFQNCKGTLFCVVVYRTKNAKDSIKVNPVKIYLKIYEMDDATHFVL